MAKRAATKAGAVGSVALYGTHAIGFGYIARTTDGRMFGDGEPMPHRSATDALWLGVTALEATGPKRGGVVTVHQDVGGVPLVAEVKLGGARPYFGDLVFKTGSDYAPTAYVIDAAAIIAASEKEAR